MIDRLTPSDDEMTAKRSVDVARAPVDVTVAGLQTGFGLVSRVARSVTGSQTPPAQPEPKKRTLLKSMKSFRSTQESSTDDVLGLSLGVSGVDLPVVTFRDDDDPAEYGWKEADAQGVVKFRHKIDKGRVFEFRCRDAPRSVRALQDALEPRDDGGGHFI